VREPLHPAAHADTGAGHRANTRNLRSDGQTKFSSQQLTLWDDVLPVAPERAPAIDQPAASTSVNRFKSPPIRTSVNQATLAEVFGRVYRRLGPRQVIPSFKVSFRRFTGLRSAIRTPRKNHIEASLSDLLEEAPPLVIEALAEILITRLFRMKTSREANECYRAWAESQPVVRRTEEIRRLRGRKRLRPPEGFWFNLREVFDDLNHRYFGGEVVSVRIGWSPNRSRTMLGHFDSSHRTITVTRWLDAHRVPRYVVEYLVFHEMLHARFPVEHRNHRRVVHSAAFREAERAFPHYNRAIRWLRGMKIDG